MNRLKFNVPNAKVWIVTGLQCFMLVSALRTKTEADKTEAGPACATAHAGAANDLLSELRKARLELMEYRVEAQAAKLPSFELALRQIQMRRSQLLEEEPNKPKDDGPCNLPWMRMCKALPIRCAWNSSVCRRFRLD